MKKILLTMVLAAITGGALFAQTIGAQQVSIQDRCGLEFYEEVCDLGEVPEGPDHVFDMAYHNTGKQPVQIVKATAGCGCVSFQWPKGATLPADKGKLTVIYHTNEHAGLMDHIIHLKTDTHQHVMLQIKGRVLPRPTLPATAYTDTRS